MSAQDKQRLFLVDKSENRIKKITKTSFSDEGMKERQHLQEWLANQPDALGEDLLIIQKEFAGFEDTKERLDLLALDKEGNLVVIENKRDDSGRNVTWQASKYAAYVSTLSKSQIVEIYQIYLNRYCPGDNATSRLCDFFDVEEEEWEEFVLNPGNDQRIMLVAADFRLEVTATALWLLGQGIRVQCFKASPYSLEQEVILDIRQIIPLPEASDYEIRMLEKRSEERAARKSSQKYYDFWEKTLETFRARNVKLFADARRMNRQYLVTTGISEYRYSLHMLPSKKEMRVALDIKGKENQIKQRFDDLFAKKEDLEQKFGNELQWQPKGERVRCRIYFSKEIDDGFDESNWPDMIDWLAENIRKLESAFKCPLADLKKREKSPSRRSKKQNSGDASGK